MQRRRHRIEEIEQRHVNGIIHDLIDIIYAQPPLPLVQVRHTLDNMQYMADARGLQHYQRFQQALRIARADLQSYFAQASRQIYPHTHARFIIQWKDDMLALLDDFIDPFVEGNTIIV